MGDAASLKTWKAKPIIVAVAYPAFGHNSGMIHISSHLVKHGFKVYFVSGSDFEGPIKESGAEYIENTFNFVTPEWMKGVSTLDGIESFLFALKEVFLKSTPTGFPLLRATLERVRDENPGRQVIIFHEAMASSVLPYYYGAPLPKGYDQLPKMINFHTTINFEQSSDVFPIGPALPPASNDKERAMVKEMWDSLISKSTTLNDYASDIYKTLGATKDVTDFYFDRLMNIGEVTLLPYSPSMEFPRSDLNPKIKFIGTLPVKPIRPDLVYPLWWADIEANARLPVASTDRKKVVFVTQGTVTVDYTELLIPTLRAIASRSDLIVIATLGSRGKTLPDDVKVGANVRVLDYFSYDAILQKADVFVSNAGFGTYLHGVVHGVPMVLAGTKLDKADVSARAEYCGIAIDLKTQKPTQEALAEAVDKVLGDPKYKMRSIEIKKENEALDTLGAIEKIILSYAE
ncbi:glycosyltransferase family 1 protein [Clohesyomyces aquaticus]|uniref:Glycosyltransferase family 1 protein n=1 Tax=Clohesyomyces aquaticus TaxID=1231657 RepID=A0A1Y2A316_9PLEO|nr:glycosyltransferase family 1 protein [Clohesyomyces aquaticus]